MTPLPDKLRYLHDTVNTTDTRCTNPKCTNERCVGCLAFAPKDTPDTEWKRQLRIDFEVAYGSMPKNFEHVPSVHISDWWLEKLSSRDTYWKERVRKEVDGLQERFGDWDNGDENEPLLLKCEVLGILDNLK